MVRAAPKSAGKKKPAPKSKAKVTKAKAGKSSAKAAKEREHRKKILRWKRNAAIAATVMLALGVWKGAENRVDLQAKEYAMNLWLEYTHSAGFRFEELILEGRSLTEPQRIVDAVGLEVGDPLFLVSLDDIRDRLLDIDTVKDAHVARDLSGKIAVTLVERKPFVLWQYRGRVRVMDDDGVVLLKEKPEDYPYLVTMVGEKAPANIENLVSFLAADKALAEQITAAVFVSDRRWDIHFANGIQILLPELNPRAAWKKLASMQREHNILEQQVQAIDLRIDDRVFITLPEGAVEDGGNASDV